MDLHHVLTLLYISSADSMMIDQKSSHRNRKRSGMCRPQGAGGAPPTFREFSVFPSKNAVFYVKKDRQIEKIGVAPPHFKIIYIQTF
jgi:hypothetical protein